MTLPRIQNQDMRVGDGISAVELPASRRCINRACKKTMFVRTQHLKAGKIRCPYCGTVFKLVFKVALLPEDHQEDPDLAEPIKPWFWGPQDEARTTHRPAGDILEGTVI